MTHALSQSAPQRRSAQRTRTLLRGKLVWLRAGISIDCTIRDLSDAGAGVTFPMGQIIPEQPHLIQARSGEAWECRVAWQTRDRIGVAFVRRHDLEATSDPELKRLAQIRRHIFG